MLAGVQRDELKILLHKLVKISADKFTKVELKQLILALATNTVTRMVAGKRYYGEDVARIKEARHLRELIDQIFILGGESYPGDFLPVYKYFDIQGFEKKVKKLASGLDVYFQGWVDKRRRNKNMIAGGTRTIAAMTEWAMANLLNNPEMLKKVIAELDPFLNSNQLLGETDLSKLPYLQNIISESFRLHPAVPLLAPHVYSDNLTIGGYNVPAQTILLINACAIHRDSKVWDDPTRFNLQRFDASEADDPYKLLPFGVGMRQFPGRGFAKRIIGLTVGTLIQFFEWERVDEKPIDLVEQPTGILMPKTLEILCKTRSIMNDVLIHDVL
ncbi:hypothetical protein REPUB_Repub09cG0157600 [Reevesia pubescens]